MLIDLQEMPWTYKGDDPHEPRFVNIPTPADGCHPRPPKPDYVFPHDCDCNPEQVATLGNIKIGIGLHNRRHDAHNELFRRVYDKIEDVRKEKLHTDSIVEFDEHGDPVSEIFADARFVVNGQEKRLLTSDDDTFYGQRFYLYDKRIKDVEDLVGTARPTFDSEQFDVTADGHVSIKEEILASDYTFDPEQFDVTQDGAVSIKDEILASDYTFDTDQFDVADGRVSVKEGVFSPPLTFDENQFNVSSANIITLAHPHTFDEELFAVDAGGMVTVREGAVDATSEKLVYGRTVYDAIERKQFRYPYVPNVLDKGGFIKLFDLSANSCAFTSDTPFTRFEFVDSTDATAKNGFFYYDYENGYTTGVHIIPSFLSESLSGITDEIYIPNPLPSFPYTCTAFRDDSDGNIHLKIPFAGGDESMSFDTGFTDAANVTLKFARAYLLGIPIGYTAILSFEEDGVRKWYTMSPSQMLQTMASNNETLVYSEHTTEPQYSTYVNTVGTVVVGGMRFEFDFAGGILKVVEDGESGASESMFHAETAVTTYNTVLLPRSAKDGKMREFILNIRMTGCEHPATLVPTDCRNVTVLDKFEFFGRKYLPKLADEDVYFRFQEAKPDRMVVELMGVPPSKLDETLSSLDVLDMDSTDWDVRLKLARIWELLGGAVVNK